MSKRLKLPSRFLVTAEVNEDRISELPDEILVKILSRLTLRKAAQTSILSRRWKTLWTFITGNLDFGTDPITLSKRRTDHTFQFLQEERKRYVDWVNQVLNSHQGAIINVFKVCIDLDNTYKFDVDRWIEFAIQKKSQTLNIDFMPHRRNPKKDHPYLFPGKVLGFSNIKILKYLRLCSVDVSGPVFDHILCNCTCLEALSIVASRSLVHAKVCGPSLKLKFIEIRICKHLEYIEVSAANLESLVYHGPTQTSIRIRHAPKLGCVYLGGCYCDNRFPSFSELSSVFSQLDTFVLKYRRIPFLGFLSTYPTTGLPGFKNLKCLELKVSSHGHGTLLFRIYMISACPMLHRLGVEFHWRSTERRERKMEKIELREKLKRLKHVEFTWFGGRTADVELVISILENAPYVDTLKFNTWYQTKPTFISQLKSDFDEDIKAAIECARQLANKHSPRANLTVL